MSKASNPLENSISLGDLFRINTDQITPKDFSDRIFIHYSIPAYDEFQGPVSESSNAIESNKFWLSKPCVLVSKLNPRKSRVKAVMTVEDFTCASTEFICFEPRSDILDLKFWEAYFANGYFSARLAKIAVGSTNSHTRASPRETLRWLVPNPPAAVQAKIAEILDTLDAAIQGTEAVVAKLKAMKQGLLHDLLTRGTDANKDLRPPQPEAPHLYKQTPLGWLPKEWDVIELGSLIRELTQGWSPDCPSEAALAHEWGILKTTAVVWSGYQEHENKRLPEGMRPRPLLQVEVDDILITRAGPSSRVAVVAHVPDTRDKLMISDKLYRLRITSTHNPSFIATALSSMAVQREISKTISGMAESQTNISQAALKPLPVPIPSRREQDEIMLGLQAQSQKLRDEEDLLEKLHLLKSGLMDDLLTGRTSVTPLL
ncbi:restriction endonuclease subunit S [Acetobacter thailandicus]|uniref:Restriction endonuclease subunit S n=1 Tax=Acetobacter thailandicus TaxID=1502842 RepID=A0ABT3QCJ3_9PROT|nr:restriction endonuclease subunit S [Acetobacter thailandicus]MCX2563008.1 restriction endonuclease subunit S [Acetobacter thailandicus]NHN96144.1 restriction endonuclease subunit S [Acetobacter thailandicus]